MHLQYVAKRSGRDERADRNVMYSHFIPNQRAAVFFAAAASEMRAYR